MQKDQVHFRLSKDESRMFKQLAERFKEPVAAILCRLISKEWAREDRGKDFPYVAFEEADEKPRKKRVEDEDDEY